MQTPWWRTVPAADATLLEEARRRWRLSQSIVLAAVVAVFPFLFILDEASAFAFSPVIPGLILCVAALVLAPIALMEVLHRRALRRRAHGHEESIHLDRLRLTSRVATGVAVAWLVLWLAWGA